MWTELHSAAGDDNVQEIERLLAARADINATDNAGLVPLHIAAGEGAAAAVAPSPRRAAAARLYCTAAYACARCAPLSPPPWRFRPSVFARTERTSMRSLGSMIPPRCTAWSVRSPSVCVCAASHLRPSVAQPRGDVRAAVGTEQAPAGRGGAQRLPRSARGCRRRPQRQVASRRNCALRQLRAAF